MKNFKNYRDQEICDWTRRVYHESESLEREMEYVESEAEEAEIAHLLNIASTKLYILLTQCTKRGILFGINTAL